MGIKVGIAGGIGSGKTIICHVFKVLGIPVYNADLEAKLIMNKSDQVRLAVMQEFGDEAYSNGVLNRAFLAAQVFNDAAKLAQLNRIVHPAVIQAAEDWADAQTAPYSLKEASILFESGSYKKVDYSILVTAPIEIRIARVMERDQVTREQVLARMNNQMSDEEKTKLADFVIINDGITPIIPQVMALHHQFQK
ncbi:MULTISPECIES: dephospho-CoA kinase [Sphingobacterium]|nr:MULTISPECIES: dephospho-CoA kinase [Sphingobacterium]MBB2949714.1 dephospho-CoA kinase [Sphingobacterium sp. JUb56]MCS3556512.1 dephospho-CoA kinase [Sphingobacterium sp. JUb21]MCW2263584.1 dephospho-CoA kinase [Sphingobacterium kitahiroshimense]QQD12230.1 dephospho-CoA kinase [Sphingobacterium sp. UDSM-2020]